MEFDKPSRFWSAVGRIALLVTVIGSGVELWRNLAPRSNVTNTVLVPSGPVAQLVGTINSFAFDMPPDVISQFEAFRGLETLDSPAKFLQAKDDATIESIVSEVSLTVSELQYPDRKRQGIFSFSDALKGNATETSKFRSGLDERIAPMLREYVRSGWIDDNSYHNPSYSSFVLLEIHNNGDRQAVGVELDLPYDGIATIAEAGEKPVVKPFNQKIIVGTILPKASRKLELWTSTQVTSYPFDLEKWQLTYVDGVGKLTWKNPEKD